MTVPTILIDTPLLCRVVLAVPAKIRIPGWATSPREHKPIVSKNADLTQVNPAFNSSGINLPWSELGPIHVYTWESLPTDLTDRLLDWHDEMENDWIYGDESDDDDEGLGLDHDDDDVIVPRLPFAVTRLDNAGLQNRVYAGNGPMGRVIRVTLDSGSALEGTCGMVNGYTESRIRSACPTHQGDARSRCHEPTSMVVWTRERGPVTLELQQDNSHRLVLPGRKSEAVTVDIVA